jgi:uncharacterized protein (DUF4415 family)
MTTKSNRVYADRHVLAPDEFEPRGVKVRITTMVDEDVLAALKKIAAKKRMKYQTLLNEVLRSFVGAGPKGASLSEERVRRIVQEELRKRA